MTSYMEIFCQWSAPHNEPTVQWQHSAQHSANKHSLRTPPRVAPVEPTGTSKILRMMAITQAWMHVQPWSQANPTECPIVHCTCSHTKSINAFAVLTAVDDDPESTGSTTDPDHGSTDTYSQAHHNPTLHPSHRLFLSSMRQQALAPKIQVNMGYLIHQQTGPTLSRCRYQPNRPD